ncbi:MAG: electron transport complex subunit RsxC [Gammaproteobacteria bacterium]|nr:electron transport complex subunit RsxC [Gammaproteobacteria bacterium]
MTSADLRSATTPWRYDPQPRRPGWGIHGATFKRVSRQAPIQVAPLPAVVTLCLRQGAVTAVPLVTTGERVDTGQPVAVAADGTQIHASVTGIVTGIGPHPVPGPEPGLAPCIVVRRDAPDRWHESCEPLPEPSRLDAADICRRIAAAGIVGLGGALFPTARKLAPGAPIRALLVNGVECEPWITCDEVLLRERAATVIAGARIAMHALGTAQAVIAVEGDMPEARVAVHDALQAAGDCGIGLAVVTAKYPAGGERQLIELLTGEEVPAGGLPRDIGYVVQNVGTLAAIAALFRSGEPLVSRIVTVTGSGVAAPGNVEARIGTPMRDLVDLAGGYRYPPTRLLMGGPMMGFALPDDDLAITKATNCIVAATAAEVAPPRPEMACIRCGECVQACPARLLPHELHAALRRGDTGLLGELALDACIECGCCDFVCPSQIPLTARFVAARRAASPGGEATP